MIRITWKAPPNMAMKPKSHRQQTLEREADTLQGLVDKTQRKIDKIRAEIAEMEAARSKEKQQSM